MSTNITISGLTGQSPFDIYICDSGSVVCYFVNTITNGDIPYVFEVPFIFNSLTSFNVRAIDNNDCLINKIVVV
jgi:hypothetical protein